MNSRIGKPLVVVGLLGWAVVASMKWASKADLLERTRNAVVRLESDARGATKRADEAEQRHQRERMRADAAERREAELEADLKHVMAKAAETREPGKDDAARYLFRTEKSLLAGRSAATLKKDYEAIPPLFGDKIVGPEIISIHPWISLQAVRESDCEAALQGTISFRLDTMRRNGAKFTEVQRRAYEASEKTYWSVITDLQRRGNWIRNRMETEKGLSKSDRENLSQTLCEIDSHVTQLHMLEIAEEFRLLGEE